LKRKSWSAWISDKLLGPVIDWAINKTPLKDLVRTMTKVIESALGVSDLKVQVTRVLSESLSKVQAPLQNIVGQTQSLDGTVDEVSHRLWTPPDNADVKWCQFTKKLLDMRERPIKELSTVVSKGI